MIIGVRLKICEEPRARAASESMLGCPAVTYATETINCAFLHLQDLSQPLINNGIIIFKCCFLNLAQVAIGDCFLFFFVYFAFNVQTLNC